MNRRERDKTKVEEFNRLCASPDWKTLNNPPMDVWFLVKGDDYMGEWIAEVKYVWKNPTSLKRTAKGWKCRSGNYLDDRPSYWMHLPQTPSATKEANP